MLINSYTSIYSSEANRSKDWIPETEDSTRVVFYTGSLMDKTMSWRIETRNNIKFENKNGKIASINFINNDRISRGFLGFYRLKECSSINASFFVRYQDSGNFADRFKIYWGEFKNYQSLPVLYNFTILKDGHFRVSKSIDKSKPNWVCIYDGFANNWNPANIYNVICIQQNGSECKISINGGIQIYTILDSFDGIETGLDIFSSDSWEIKKIEFAD